MSGIIYILIRTSKKDYYDRYFMKHKNNLSKTWQGIKQIINMKSKKSDYPSCIIHDGITITDPTEIANKFNNFYTSIADDILEKRKYNGNNVRIPMCPSIQMAKTRPQGNGPGITHINDYLV